MRRRRFARVAPLCVDAAAKRRPGVCRRAPPAPAGRGGLRQRRVAALADYGEFAPRARRGTLQLWQLLGDEFQVSAEAVNRRFVRTRPNTSYKQVDAAIAKIMT